MDIVITSVVPLFSVIFIGFAAGRLKIIDGPSVRALVTFVFSFAMPALIFRMMATTDVMAIDDWPVIFAYFAAQLPIFIGGQMIGGWMFRQSLAERTIQGFGSSFSNGVVLGLPLVLNLYGEQAGVPALLIIMLDIAVFSTITLLMEFASLKEGCDQSPHHLIMLRDLGRSVAANPLIMASLLGITFGLTSLSMPGPVEETLAFFGQAGPPAGLFALGATLGQRRLGGKVKPVAAMISMKLMIHPLLAWLVISQWFELDPIASNVVLLLAACPVGANVYIFAAQYAVAEETSATAILLSTSIGLFSLSGLALLLSGGHF